MIQATAHSIDRYIERVAPVSRIEAEAALTNKRINAAASFGADYIRLGSGHRAVIVDGFVVTILPADTKRGYIAAKLREMGSR